MASFTKEEIDAVKLKHYHEAAGTVGVKAYGTKADLAGKIVSSKGGKVLLRKLISTSLKEKEKKEAKKGDGPKATFMEKKRARLVASGATDKKKIEEDQSTSKPLKIIAKKTPAKKTPAKKLKVDGKIINSSKLLPDSVCKARNLTLVGSDSSTGKTVYKYKVKEMSMPAKASPKKAKKDADDDEDDSDDDADDSDDAFENACAEVEERAISRLKSKKIKREHINGVLEAFGVDASGWKLPHAKEEFVVQLLNETDDENSDDEQEEDSDDEEEEN